MPSSFPRRRRRVAIISVVFFAAAAFVALAVLLVDRDAVTDRVVDHFLPGVSERLGRQLRLEATDARIFPPRVTLHRLSVEGRAGEPPLLEVQEVQVELRLWPLLRSLGREVQVEAVILRQPELNLVRDKEGTWNFEGLGAEEPSGREVAVIRAQVEDGTVRIIDRRGSHGEAVVALQQVDLTLEELATSQPLQVQLSAAVASEAQNLSASFTLPPPGPGGGFPKVEGKLSLDKAQLTRFEGLLPARLGTLVMGGLLDLEARVRTMASGQYLLEGDGALQEVRLRGQPASGRLRVAARVDPSSPSSAKVEVDRLALRGPGIDLGGEATFTAAPLALGFALRGPLLDVDTLLGVLPEEEVTAPPERTSMLPSSMRRALDQLQAQGTLEVKQVVRGKLQLEELRARAQLRRGVLTLEEAQARLYGGQVVASGSSANLLLASPSWHLRARLEEVDASALFAAVSGHPVVEGQLDAAFDVEGEGADWELVQKSASGQGVLSLAGGALTSTDLGHRLLQAAGVVGEPSGRTELSDLALSFRLRDGRLLLRELSFRTAQGGVRLSGSIGLDTSLQLQGSAALSADFVAQATGRRPPGPVEIPLGVGGNLRKPSLQLPSAGELASAAAAPAAREGAKQVEEEVRRQARRRVGDVLRRLGGGD